jgi:hypothetical protein
MKSFACMFLAKISKLTSNLRYNGEAEVEWRISTGGDKEGSEVEVSDGGSRLR